MVDDPDHTTQLVEGRGPRAKQLLLSGTKAFRGKVVIPALLFCLFSFPLVVYSLFIMNRFLKIFVVIIVQVPLLSEPRFKTYTYSRYFHTHRDFLVLTTIHQDCFHCPHFRAEETEAQPDTSSGAWADHCK